jgi:hypothetical protein
MKLAELRLRCAVPTLMDRKNSSGLYSFER